MSRPGPGSGSGSSSDAARPEVDEALVDRLAAVCLALPEVRQEQAWIGTRWRVRTKVFAHVVRIVGGHPPVYAREAGADDATVVTFRSAGVELDALGAHGGRKNGGPAAVGAGRRRAPPRRRHRLGGAGRAAH